MTAEPIEAPSGAAPPRAWTVDDLEALPEDGCRRELIDGVLHVSPSPGNNHQIVAMRLGVSLEEGCPAECQVTQGVDVRINHRRQFVPDVLVTTDEAARRTQRPFEAREVILAVEIVSPTSQAMDRILKPALYAQAGIPFYWRIEVTDRLSVHAYKAAPSGDVYTHVGEFTEVIELAEPWPITIPVSRLTPRHLPPAAE